MQDLMQNKYWHIFHGRKEVMKNILKDFRRTFTDKTDEELKNDITEFLFFYSKLDQIFKFNEHSWKNIENDDEEKEIEKKYPQKPFHEFILERIATIKDTKTKNYIFKKTYLFFNEINFKPTKSNIENVINSLYENMKEKEVTFLRKKFPDISMSKNHFFLNLIEEQTEGLTPENKIKQIERSIRYYNIKKIIPIYKYGQKNHGAVSIIMYTDKITRNYPKIITKLLAMGDALDNRFIEKLYQEIQSDVKSDSNKKILSATLDQMKDILLKYFDFEKINSNDILECLAKMSQFFKQNEQKTILKKLKNKPTKLTFIKHLISSNNINELTKKRKYCNELTLSERPFYFEVIQKLRFYPKEAILFLKSNDIDYSLTDKNGNNVIDSVLSRRHFDEKNKIIEYIELCELNLSTNNEFNL